MSPEFVEKIHKLTKNQFCNTNLHHIDANNSKHCSLLDQPPPNAKKATNTYAHSLGDHITIKSSMGLDDHTRNDAEVEKFAKVNITEINNAMSRLIESHTALTIELEAVSEDNQGTSIAVTNDLNISNKDINIPSTYIDDQLDGNDIKFLQENAKGTINNVNVSNTLIENWNLLGGETYELYLNNHSTSSGDNNDTLLVIFAKNSFLYGNDGTLSVQLRATNSTVKLLIVSYFTKDFYYMLYNAMLNKSGIKVNGFGNNFQSFVHSPKPLTTNKTANETPIESFNGLTNNSLNIVVILSVLIILCLVFILIN